MKDFACFFVFLFSFFSFSLSAQQNDGLNMTELYHHDVAGQEYKDCWGYVADDGREYAIIGTRVRIYFYDITDPENTVLVEQFYHNSVPGLSMNNTNWRDFKTYGDKAYAAAGSGSEGLLVFDLSGLPDTVILEEQNTSFFGFSHSIFIDTLSGFLYTAGANVQSNGTRILDLNDDPITQEASVALSGGYIHDIHVRDGLAYCFSDTDGMYVYDFSTNPSSPTYLGNLSGYVGAGYNHSGWLTDSGDHIVFCDETTGTKVKICDVTDPANLTNLSITDQFYSVDPVSSTLAHNPFVKGDFAYVSYYDDGVYVFDISDPTDVTIHAYYDTNPTNSGYGCWGVWPYFPSGSIIATDGTDGFYVMQLGEPPLPVELSRFEAMPEDNKVRLEWTTASEENSAYFEIERSTDGIDFEVIGKVEAMGRSTEKVEYLTYDDAPFKGDNYYRLKQVDLDGKFEYSEIVSVFFSTALVEVYPTFINAEQTLNVLFSESISDLQFSLYNIQGQLLASHLLSGNEGEEMQLPIGDLANGTYILHVYNNAQQMTQRVVVAK
jgi:choice-of-anchor B domain-containing protein